MEKSQKKLPRSVDMPATRARQYFQVAIRGGACPALVTFDPRYLVEEEAEVSELMACAEVVPSSGKPRPISAALAKARQFPLRIVSKQEDSRPEKKVILQLDEYQ